MRRYLLRRLLIFIPTLFAITLIAFLISVNTPGDPVDEMLQGPVGQSVSVNAGVSEREYQLAVHRLGLDKPLFYFSLSAMAEPDTLYRIPRKGDRKFLSALIYEYGNWPEISAYFESLKALQAYVAKEKELGKYSPGMKAEIENIRNSADPAYVLETTRKLGKKAGVFEIDFPELTALLTNLEQRHVAIISRSAKWKIYIPSFHFYGLNNQYHDWIIRLVTLNMGTSMQDHKPVLSKFMEALPWTLVINFISILLSYLISIPIGIYSAVYRDTVKERAASTFLFVLHSLPTFWVATLLINFLCNPDYLNWFPSHGTQGTAFDEQWPFWKKLGEWSYHLILPMICYTYSGFAFLSRQMRVGMLETLNADYIRTARSKGLSERIVIMRHALRNSLIPVVTIFGNLLPSLIGGSIVIETIFSLPGMGYTMYTALQVRDYPLLIFFFTLLGILTQLGILISDLMYKMLDPRINFSGA